MKHLVTGGAGFIGSAVCRELVGRGEAVVNVDALTYAANLRSLDSIADSPLYAFEQADITDAAAMARVFATHLPDRVMHLAAESHVDRSITGPGAFISTNVLGTYTLLSAALDGDAPDAMAKVYDSAAKNGLQARVFNPQGAGYRAWQGMVDLTSEAGLARMDGAWPGRGPSTARPPMPSRAWCRRRRS